MPMRPRQLSEIAQEIDGEFLGPADPLITGLAGLDSAGDGDLSFIRDRKKLAGLSGTHLGGLLIGPGMETDIPAIRVADPFLAFAGLLKAAAPDPDLVWPPEVHATAVIHPEAEVDPSVAVGPYCVIGPACRIGAGTRLGAHVVLGHNVQVGRDCLFHPRVTVACDTVIGDEVICQAGCIIGTDGFGFLPGPEGLVKIPQVGRVVIGDRVEIGSGTCIDRATTGETVIGSGTKIDNQVQIAHNVKIGNHCAVSAQTGISGSSELGNGVTLGGGVGIGDHLKVGDGARIGGRSGLIKDVPPGATQFGYPALDFKESFRIIAAVRRLPELIRRVARLEKNSSGPKAEKE